MDDPSDVAGPMGAQQIGLRAPILRFEEGLDGPHRAEQMILVARTEPADKLADLFAGTGIEGLKGGPTRSGQ